MSEEELIKSFKENTTRTTDSAGRVYIDCKRGLWGVSSSYELGAMREAHYYFRQYYADGEYDGSSNEQVMKKLLESKND